jgi:hypothetical protein
MDVTMMFPAKHGVEGIEDESETQDKEDEDKDDDESSYVV